MREKNKAVRFLSIDFGTKWMGVAMGNRETSTVTPLPHLQFSLKSEASWRQLDDIVQAWNIDAGLVGYPLNMDGSAYWLTKRVELFAKLFQERYGCELFLQDERLSTCSAKEELFALYGKKGLTKSRIDSAAAALLLETYFLENGHVEKHS